MLSNVLFIHVFVGSVVQFLCTKPSKRKRFTEVQLSHPSRNWSRGMCFFPLHPIEWFSWRLRMARQVLWRKPHLQRKMLKVCFHGRDDTGFSYQKRVIGLWITIFCWLICKIGNFIAQKICKQFYPPSPIWIEILHPSQKSQSFHPLLLFNSL